MTKKEIDRINELGRKSKTPEGLTEAEKQEQQQMRESYLAWFRMQLRGGVPASDKPSGKHGGTATPPEEH